MYSKDDDADDDDNLYKSNEIKSKT